MSREEIPDAHTPQAPCTPATSSTDAYAALLLPESLLRCLCSTPPGACPQLSPRVRSPPLHAHQPVPSTALRSLPARSGNLGSSPESRSAPETRCSHPQDTAPDHPFGTSALYHLPQMDLAETSPPLTPD